jgi:uncharacterized protein
MSAGFNIDIVSGLSTIDAAQWDACAQAHNTSADAPTDITAETHNPFVSHAFLTSLEDSGSATAKTGWAGAHIIVRDENNIIRAACPTYLKAHSMGEYVFDHTWADAWERAGGRYYPKVQVCVPFTPVTGPRLLIHPECARAEGEALLAKGLLTLSDRCEASSVHMTFAHQRECEALAPYNFVTRLNKQFHFINHGYADFDAFLAALASRKRKMIKRERKEAVQEGIEIEHLTGTDITETHWDAFYEFYMDTGSRKWGQPYLTRQFFSLIGERMSSRILLIMAKRAGRYIAGAINFIGNRHLYGRNWGCIEHHPFLHFEVCYYQAIEYALKHGFARVEAGAQGEHKLMRGYEPVETYSAHFIAHEGFARAVKAAIEQERAHMEVDLDFYAQHLPFKKTEGQSHDL